MKNNLFFIVLFFSTTNTFTQSDSIKNPQPGVLDGVYLRNSYTPKRRISSSYRSLDSSNKFVKTVWSTIDSSQILFTANLWGTDPKYSNNTRNTGYTFWELIQVCIFNGDLQLYSPYNPNFYSKNDGDVFNYPIYIDSSVETMQSHEVLLPYFTKTRADGQRSFYRTQEIVQYRLKEEWYFDRERNVLERKIIGIAPVVNTFDVGGEKTGLSELFWLYFPACQKVFENYHCDQAEQNFKGTSLMTCFKDRLFNSYIIKESNLCPTKVDEYIKAINALLDYQMIRDKLSQLESELWLY